VEDCVNEMIAENRAVTTRTIPRQEADMLLAAGALLKLPDLHGDIRLIEIDEVDLNACGGTHVQATGQIGGLHLRGTERMRNGVRLEFVCGLRAAVAARHSLSTLKRAGALLSVASSEVADSVERLLVEGRAARKTLQKLTEELAALHAKNLLAEGPSSPGRRIVRQVFDDRDAGYLKLLASQLVAGDPQIGVLLASIQEEPARVVMAAGGEVKLHCGTLLREALAAYGLRAGGSPGMAQGQISRAHLDALFQGLEEAFRQV